MKIKNLNDILTLNQNIFKIIIFGYLEDFNEKQKYANCLNIAYPALIIIPPSLALFSNNTQQTHEQIELEIFAGIEYNKKTDDKCEKYDLLEDYIRNYIDFLNTKSKISIINKDNIRVTYLEEAGPEFALFIKFNLIINYYFNAS